MDTFHTYTWNADAHPLTIDSSTCGANGICLTYDALGRMVEKNISGSYSEVLYGPTGKLAIMNGQALVNSYIPLPGGATFNLAAGYARLWHKDWLGTVRLSTTLSNRTVDYDRALAPFGETYSNFGSSTNYNFAGDTQDTISGTYDTVNRELNPSQGRWLIPDPAGLGSIDLLNPQTFNRYAYVLDSPLTWVDPTGLDINADGCIWNQNDTTNTLNCPVPDVNQIPSDAANNENTLNVQAANLSEIALRQRAANKSILTPQQQKALHCVGQAAAAKGVSIALDIAGSIPAFGNLFSGTVEGIQALNASYYGTVALASAGNTLLNPSASGAAFTATSAALTVGSVALRGSRVIPVVGTLVSLGTLAYDATKAVQAYQQCMAGGG